MTSLTTWERAAASWARRTSWFPILWLPLAAVASLIALDLGMLLAGLALENGGLVIGALTFFGCGTITTALVAIVGFYQRINNKLLEALERAGLDIDAYLSPYRPGSG